MNIMFFLKPKSELAYIYDYHTLRQAMEIMEYHKYSCVPILNKEGKYVGSITEGDVLWALKKLDIFNIKEADDQEHFIGIITRRDIIGYCYDKLKEYGTQDDH